ncbi:hypothetical protein [Nocardia arthritidis]|uniref:Uncharacterized protein n=1 Tax=Nocardia arthritidis TaxID=228602 RepID=A0A6G9YB88_9NOCA|nr:hypothetical protein [Nocardia arthritidis]QIS10347.1 hypothetical protein F5544_12280 [Nocardia arthritidis]
MTTPERILDVARGDAAVSRQLSDALRLLAAKSTDPALKDQIGAVLSGRVGVRDFARTDAFNQTLDRVMPAALEKYQAMSEEQRQRLAEQGEQELERYRAELVERSPVQAPDVQSPSPESSRQGTFTSNQDDSTGRLIPGTRKPNRDQIVTPDEPDDDDLYFQDRRRRGWLE